MQTSDLDRTMTPADPRRWDGPLRIAAWGGAALLFLAPFVAEQVWDEMDWGGEDYLAWAVLLLIPCSGFELVIRASSSWSFRLGAAVALGAAFLLIWVNIAVGVIGSEDNPANLMYGAVLAIGVLGAAAARLRARGMAATMTLMAAATVLTGVIAIIAGWGSRSELNWAPAIIGSTLFWGTAWLVSAILFRAAARERKPNVAAS